MMARKMHKNLWNLMPAKQTARSTVKMCCSGEVVEVHGEQIGDEEVDKGV